MNSISFLVVVRLVVVVVVVVVALSAVNQCAMIICAARPLGKNDDSKVNNDSNNNNNGTSKRLSLRSQGVANAAAYRVEWACDGAMRHRVQTLAASPSTHTTERTIEYGR